MNEVQDFSMPNKNKQISSNKGKLDSMLDKLMKRKNCVRISRNYLFIYYINNMFYIYIIFMNNK